MTRRLPLGWVGLALLAGALACGPLTGGGPATPTTGAPVASMVTAPVPTPAPLETAAPAATATTASSPTAAPPVIVARGVVVIEQLTPTEAAGPYPQFAGQPVEEAVRYALVVNEEDGRPYWAWSGTQTAIYLGGGTESPPEDSAGPVLLRPMTWTVVAYNEEGTLVGSSPERPVAP